MLRCVSRLRASFSTRRQSTFTLDRELSPSDEPQASTSLTNEEFLCENNGKFATLTDKLQAGAPNFEKFYRYYETQRPIIEAIQNRIQHADNSRLVLYGSFASGLAYDCRDLDFMMIPKDKVFWKAFKEEKFRKHCFEALETLIKRLPYDYPELAGKFEFDRNYLLMNVRTPMMTTVFKSGLIVDIYFSEFYDGLRTTNLVKHYNMADPRFGQLYYWLRSYLMQLGLIYPKWGLLTSFHVQYLIAHFLQSTEVTNPPVVPVVLQTHPKLVDRSNIPTAKLIEMLHAPLEPLSDWKSENTLTSGELIPRLVDYYANFDHKITKILISTGEVERISSSDDPHDESTLQLIDPYSNNSISRYSITADCFAEAMQFIHRNMAKGRMIDTFPEFPEVSQFAKEMQGRPWLRLTKGYEGSDKPDDENKNEFFEIHKPDWKYEPKKAMKEEYMPLKEESINYGNDRNVDHSKKQKYGEKEANYHQDSFYLLPRKPTRDVIVDAMMRAEPDTMAALLEIQNADDLPVLQSEFFVTLQRKYDIHNQRIQRKVWNALCEAFVESAKSSEDLLKESSSSENDQFNKMLSDSGEVSNTSSSGTESIKYEESSVAAETTKETRSKEEYRVYLESLPYRELQKVASTLNESLPKSERILLKDKKSALIESILKKYEEPTMKMSTFDQKSETKDVEAEKKLDDILASLDSMFEDVDKKK